MAIHTLGAEVQVMPLRLAVKAFMTSISPPFGHEPVVTSQKAGQFSISEPSQGRLISSDSVAGALHVSCVSELEVNAPDSVAAAFISRDWCRACPLHHVTDNAALESYRSRGRAAGFPILDPVVLEHLSPVPAQREHTVVRRPLGRACDTRYGSRYGDEDRGRLNLPPK